MKQDGLNTIEFYEKEEGYTEKLQPADLRVNYVPCVAGSAHSYIVRISTAAYYAGVLCDAYYDGPEEGLKAAGDFLLLLATARYAG